MNLQLGTALMIEGEAHRVVAIGAGEVTLRRETDGRRVQILAAELARSADAASDTAAPIPLDADLQILGELLPEEQAEIRWWVGFLSDLNDRVKVATNAGQPVAPVFQDALRRAREAGHPVSLRTLYNKRQRCAKGGAAGLIDARRARVAVASRHQEVLQAMREVLVDTVDESTGTATRIFFRVRQRLEEAAQEAVTMPSAATMYRLLAQVDPSRRAMGSAATRRSLENRPEQFSSLGVSAPGEQVQIDSTMLDVFVRMPDGRAERVELTVMIDVASRSLLSAIVNPHGTKSVDLVVGLARALVPADRRPPTGSLLRDLAAAADGPQLVSEEELASAQQAMPYIWPASLTTDRGRVFVSDHFENVCSRLGISLVRAAPYTPTDKAIVERTLQSINTLFVQYLAGYAGRNVDRRGKDVAAGDLHSLAHLQLLLDQWVASVWQNRPHSGLRDPLHPSITLSPNEMTAALRHLIPQAPLPFDAETYVRLMPVSWRRIQAYGVTIGHRTYDAAELGPLRGTRSAHREQDGRWPIHIDPYDLHTVWLGDRGDLIPLTWVEGQRLGPMTADVWNHARRTRATHPAEPVRLEAAADTILYLASNPPENKHTARAAARRALPPDFSLPQAVSDQHAPPPVEQGNEDATQDTIESERSGHRPLRRWGVLEEEE